MTTTERDERLYQFLGGYLHHDWQDESKTVADATRLFVRHSSDTEIADLIASIDTLIADGTAGNVDVDRVLKELQFGYHYPADDMSGLEFLRGMRALLARTAQERGQQAASENEARKGRLVIEQDAGKVVGRVMRRGETAGTPTSKVRLVLERDASMPDGYRIVTGHPIL